MWPLMVLAAATVALVAGGVFIEHDMQRALRDSYKAGEAAGKTVVELAVAQAEQKQSAHFSNVQAAGERAVSDLEQKANRLEQQLTKANNDASGIKSIDCLDPGRVRDIDAIGTPAGKRPYTGSSSRPVKTVPVAH